MNKVLGDIAMEEIRNSMRGLSGKDAKAMAVRMGDLHHVNWQHIYKITQDLRPQRKRRADAGRRTYEPTEGTDLWSAMQLVIVDKLDPDQALLTVRTRKTDAKLPTLEYFQRILRENGLGRKARRAPRRAFRQWEADNPGEIFQVDVTALKVRWQDEKTRRILRIEGIDKNHPNMDESKLRVWQIMLVDDCSRRRFLRYIATTHITSKEMVRFECEAFDRLGVPQILYTDNGSEFKGHHIKAEKILNRLLEDDGGYRHLTHAPGNSQASGKVENAHKWAEKMDRYVGLAVSEGQIVTIEALNGFADRACADYDTQKHRSTKERPIDRWHSRRVVVRRLDPDVIESALLSDEFEVVLDASMTVAHKGTIYKIPGVKPFVNFVGQKVKIVVPPSIDLILFTLPTGEEFEIEKILATADKAGEWKRSADSNAEDLRKRLKDSRKEEIKAIKEKKRLTGQIAPVPHYNVEIEQPATNVTHFPHAERIVSHEEIAAVVPIPQPVYTGKPIGYWQAIVDYQNRFDGGAEEAKAFLLGIFPDMAGELLANEVEAAIERRHEQPRHGLLRAV
jgi:transposase InsO family protein